MELKSNSFGCTPRGILVIVGGILVHLTIGAYYTFGNFSPYMISYLRNRTDDTDLRNVDGIWITSIGSISNSIGMTSGGLLAKRFGPRISTAVGCGIFSLANALTFFSIKTSFIWVIVTYGVMSKFGSSVAYGPPVQTSIKWFMDHPSLATGFIVAGFGGGALIFNQVITNYINPENLTPDLLTEEGDKYFTDSDLLDRVPSCFLVLAACYTALQIIGITMVTTPPPNHLATIKTINKKVFTGIDKIKPIEEETTVQCQNSSISIISPLETIKPPGPIEEPSLDPNTLAKQTEKSTEENLKAEYTTKEAIKKMFKTRSFYILGLGILFKDSGLQFVLGLYKAYGQTFILDDHFLALVGSISSVFNCSGRPLWGSIMDKFRYKVAAGCISAALTLLFATLFTTEYTGKAGFFVWICLIYLSFSGFPAILPATMAKLFGTTNMAVIYGFLQVTMTCGHLIGGTLAVTLRSAIGFRGLFYLAAGLNAMPFILVFFFNGRDLHGNPI